MQHHGAPTRLLDWTYSEHVAAYFALKGSLESKTDAAVWAFDPRWAAKACYDLFSDQGLRERAELFSFGGLLQEEHDALFEKAIFPPGPASAVKCVFAINAFRLNERLTLQKGVFLCPGDVSASFHCNLQAMPHYEKHVVRLVLPAGQVQTGLETLFDMNIGDATLFPGLDGFAQSLKVYFAFFPHRSSRTEGLA
jgi:hypothetical protein